MTEETQAYATCPIEVLEQISTGIDMAYDKFCEGNVPLHSHGCLRGSVGRHAVDSARGLKNNISLVRSGKKDLSAATSHAKIVGEYFLNQWDRSSSAWGNFFGDIEFNYLPNLIIEHGLFLSPRD